MSESKLIRLGTFDAERSWRPSGLATLPAVRSPDGDRVVAAMDELLAVLCGPDDLLITGSSLPDSFIGVLAGAGIAPRYRAAPPAGTDDDTHLTVEQRLLHAPPGDLAGYGLAPYAVLPETASLIRACGLRADLPGVDVVRRVSSKTWSNALARTMGLRGAGTVARSVPELLAQVEQLGSGTVVIKDPYGVAGRGTIAVSSPRTLGTVARVLQRQVDQGAAVELLVQPHYDRAADFSAQIHVTGDGEIRRRGIRLMQNAEFSYTGSRPLPAALEQRLAQAGYRELINGVGAALAAEGYHGPVCVDSMLLRDGALVPVLEINPRVSMGLISLALERRLAGPGRTARLSVRTVRLPEPSTASRVFDRLTTVLDERGALLRADRAGLLPLTVGTLRPPRGRLYYAVVARSQEEDRLLDEIMGEALDLMGRHPTEVSHAP
ncbi:hypothetical protein [Streptomyces sp. NPDC088350]|uniref:hypothetical protein n=1 Tax=Streptomyces sp. NPDC088350 TaxID=3365854 RepID=UPI00380E444C